MTNKYEDALNALTRLEDILDESFIGLEFETIRSALQLSDEAEQLRKERDEFKELYDVMVERYTELAKKVAGE